MKKVHIIQEIEEIRIREDRTKEAGIMLEDMKSLCCKIAKIDPNCRIAKIIQGSILFCNQDIEVM